MSADSKKTFKPKARVAKGFRDIEAAEIRGTREMLATIQRVYESYGFEPVEQPFIEYTDALGKFLPDQDRPNAGVFSFQDDDEQWLSLRYDLTAPLARYVAENAQKLPTPFRSYRQGWVFRNEKPGPGRYRQFMQFDADTVGSSSPAADAEVCMMAADTMEALGIPKGQYVVKVNSRKILDGLLEIAGIDPKDEIKRMAVLRALDKFDRLQRFGVLQLLTNGRKDESGAFTPGVGLSGYQAEKLLSAALPNGTTVWKDVPDGVSLDKFKELHHVASREDLAKGDGAEFYTKENYYYSNEGMLVALRDLLKNSKTGIEGVDELAEMLKFFDAAKYGSKKIQISTGVVRGLEYYTGPVFECELLIPTTDEDGKPVRFGSVGGGGRYDDLVARFTGAQVPATGFSIGVSRLYSALEHLKKNKASDTLAPVVVLVMDKERQGDYWKMVQDLRSAKIRAEMYIGTSNMQKQMKYADKRNAPLVIIQGGDEKAAGQVMIKDLRRGSELASEIESREEYASQRLAQFAVAEGDMVDAVKKALGL
jgi:histidyl-tRNA synthetase